jgi:hypothetical protein
VQYVKSEKHPWSRYQPPSVDLRQCRNQLRGCQLLQLKHLHDSPLILVGKMWSGLIEWVRASMLSDDAPLIFPGDLTIPRCVATGSEAIDLLRASYGVARASQGIGIHLCDFASSRATSGADDSQRTRFEPSPHQNSLDTFFGDA